MPTTRAPLLETKLHLPRRHGQHVVRARLVEAPGSARAASVTLASAPPGFGKTTVMADIAARLGPSDSVAWVSLDAGDNDPETFWAYVFTALERAVPEAGAGALGRIAEGPGGVHRAVTELINAMAAGSRTVVLFLDDFHLIHDAAIQEGLTFLIEHQPRGLHLVLGTRADPPLPLARLRAAGRLTEIRASDLRFTAQEAGTYLNAVMGLGLSPGDLDTLEQRTEGWIAALQLAALSMQGRDDPARFVAEFAGEDRFVLDYLVGEVLQRQPEATRDFLLKTSILSRMTGPLCDAVTAGAGGRAMLERLDRANLFLVALDDQRRWYRYHHLFADVLQAHLLDEHRDEVRDLHRRASDWFEASGDRPEAIRHALEAKDFERAADLIELATTEMRRLRREATLRRWFDALPRDVFPSRPVLAVGYAGALMAIGQVEAVPGLLEDAERALAAGPGREVAVRDEHELRRLPGAIALYRVALARLSGDVPGTMDLARRALEVVSRDDPLSRGGAEALLGLACWTTGDLEGAHRWYAAGMADLERADHITDVVGASNTLADIALAQGRLREASRIYERGLALARQERGAPLRGAADMYIGLAEVAYERGDLAEATAHLHAGTELGEDYGFPRFPYRWRVARARIAQAEGDVDGAVAILGEAERAYVSDFAPDVRPVAALRARVLVAHGRLSEARQWAEARSGELSADRGYLGEYEQASLARLLVAEAFHDGDGARSREAVELLESLLARAAESRRDGSVLDILVALALARDAADDVDGARSALGRAAALAEPEGYVRPFLDEGPRLERLLKLAARERDASPYLRRLVAEQAVERGLGEPSPGHGPALLESLSDRELDVLRLLRSDLGGPEIARQLYVSLNTLRTHTKNIYSKLGVSSRREAVRRAEDLGLLGRDRESRAEP